MALERSDPNGRRLFNHSNYKKTASQQYVSFKKKGQMSLYYNTVIGTQRKVSKAYSVVDGCGEAGRQSNGSFWARLLAQCKDDDKLCR